MPWSNRNSMTHILVLETQNWKTVWQSLIKLKIVLAYNSAIMRLGIYPNELKIYVHIKTLYMMFIAALYIVAKTISSQNDIF